MNKTISYYQLKYTNTNTVPNSESIDPRLSEFPPRTDA